MIEILEFLPTLYLWLYVALAVAFLGQGIAGGAGATGAHRFLTWTVLVLFDIEGYSHAEIAEISGMAVGSSKAQLHRARKLVREELEK